MLSGCLRCLTCFFTYASVLLLGLCLAGLEAVKDEDVVHKLGGEDVTLPSGLKDENVLNAQWLYKGSTIANKDGFLNRQQFNNRLTLNTRDFSLTVTQLTLKDSGRYSFVSFDLDENQRETAIITLEVHEPITEEPTITSTSAWHGSNQSCTINLVCHAADDSRLRYKWTVRNETRSGSTLQYVVRPQDGETRVTCTVLNSAIEKSTIKMLKCSNEMQEEEEEPIRPSLSVSPSWLTPGGSVTLKCELAPPAGWSFYWYKVFPKPLNNSYSYELMAHSSGTKQDSYVVHDQTQTSAYTCRAGRGKPVIYTQQSERCYVWSGDVHRVSLRVSPNSEQHFPSDPVLLTCEGNTAPWRLMRVTETGWVSNSSVWGKRTGSWYHIQNFTYKQAVYWCETRSGLFSNAVNISASKKDLILTSPALPVRVGDSVSLGCKLKTGSFTSDVTFYRNGDLVQNDARAELTISAASESDEGYYKCEYAGGVSLQSWLSVRATSFERKTSSFALEVIVCVIVGASVIIFPLLFCCCRKSKDSYSDRKKQHQVLFTSSDGDEIIYQNDRHPEEASTQLPGEACLYESITLPRNRRHDERSDATYTLIHLPNVMSSVGQRHGPLEDPAYINVTFRSAAGAAAP